MTKTFVTAVLLTLLLSSHSAFASASSFCAGRAGMIGVSGTTGLCGENHRVQHRSNKLETDTTRDVIKSRDLQAPGEAPLAAPGPSPAEAPEEAPSLIPVPPPQVLPPGTAPVVASFDLLEILDALEESLQIPTLPIGKDLGRDLARTLPGRKLK